MSEQSASSTLGSGVLSLVDLRRHLLRRAATLRARARGLRERGDRVGAARMDGQAERLWEVAQSMVREPGGHRPAPGTG